LLCWGEKGDIDSEGTLSLSVVWRLPVFGLPPTVSVLLNCTPKKCSIHSEGTLPLSVVWQVRVWLLPVDLFRSTIPYGDGCHGQVAGACGVKVSRSKDLQQSLRAHYSIARSNNS
jgi:hypothetical protein